MLTTPATAVAWQRDADCGRMVGRRDAGARAAGRASGRAGPPHNRGARPRPPGVIRRYVKRWMRQTAHGPSDEASTTRSPIATLSTSRCAFICPHGVPQFLCQSEHGHCDNLTGVNLALKDYAKEGYKICTNDLFARRAATSAVWWQALKLA